MEGRNQKFDFLNEHHRIMDAFPFLCNETPVQAMQYLWNGMSVYSSAKIPLPADIDLVFATGWFQQKMSSIDSEINDVDLKAGVKLRGIADALSDFSVSERLDSYSFVVEVSVSHFLFEVSNDIETKSVRVWVDDRVSGYGEHRERHLLAESHYGQRRLDIYMPNGLSLQFDNEGPFPTGRSIHWDQVKWECQLDIEICKWDAMIAALIMCADDYL
jgi:hypothetical protein